METYPDAGNCLHTLLHACFDQSASGRGKEGPSFDVSAKQIFSIREKVPRSWLSESQKLLRKALSRMGSSSGLRGVLVELRETGKPSEGGSKESRFPFEDKTNALKNPISRGRSSSQPYALDDVKHRRRKSKSDVSSLYNDNTLGDDSSMKARQISKNSNILLPPR